MGTPTQPSSIRLFLSAVSAEFRSYRDRLRHLLTRPNVEVKVQEDFIVTGEGTLEMLDDYIQVCDGVIHLVGDMSGATVSATSEKVIQERYPDLVMRLHLGDCVQTNGSSLPYTQWEAWLALLHQKPLFIASAAPEAPRDIEYRIDPIQQSLQEAHLKRLGSVGRYSAVTFTGQDHLAAEVLRSFVQDLLTTRNSETSLETAIRKCRDANTLIGIDNSKACEYFSQAIQVCDRLYAAQIGLATIEINLGNIETALIHLESARGCILKYFPEEVNSSTFKDLEINIRLLADKIVKSKRLKLF